MRRGPRKSYCTCIELLIRRGGTARGGGVGPFLSAFGGSLLMSQVPCRHRPECALRREHSRRKAVTSSNFFGMCHESERN